MSNAAYTNKYKQSWDEYQALFIAANLHSKEERQLSEDYVIYLTHYQGKIGEYNFWGSKCTLCTNTGETIAQWHAVDNKPEFYKIIKHSNGKSYLIFRQDLYGYSVLNLENGEIKQFFPEYSITGGETFIWTDAWYTPKTDVLAVFGCYWAGLYITHLFNFKDPESDNLKFVDVMECFGDNADDYGDVDFVKWENGNLHVTRYISETNVNEKVVIPKEEYLLWLSQNGEYL